MSPFDFLFCTNLWCLFNQYMYGYVTTISYFYIILSFNQYMYGYVRPSLIFIFLCIKLDSCSTILFHFWFNHQHTFIIIFHCAQENECFFLKHITNNSNHQPTIYCQRSPFPRPPCPVLCPPPLRPALLLVFLCPPLCPCP